MMGGSEEPWCVYGAVNNFKLFSLCWSPHSAGTTLRRRGAKVISTKKLFRKLKTSLVLAEV